MPEDKKPDVYEVIDVVSKTFTVLAGKIQKDLAERLQEEKSPNMAALGIVMNSLTFVLANIIGHYLSPFTREKTEEVTEKIYREIQAMLQERLSQYSGKEAWMCEMPPKKQEEEEKEGFHIQW